MSAEQCAAALGALLASARRYVAGLLAFLGIALSGVDVGAILTEDEAGSVGCDFGHDRLAHRSPERQVS